MSRDDKKTKKQLIEELATLRMQAEEIETRRSQNIDGCENCLKASENLANSLDIIRDGLVRLNILGTIVDVNQAAADIFGGSKSELIGKHFTQLGIFSPKDIPGLLSQFNDLLRNRGRESTVRITNKLGQVLFLESSVSVQRLAGKAVGIVAVVRDVTDRKRAEEALQKSEARFRTIYENAPVLINSFDENGGCVLWNNQCREVFGWTLDEINAHDDALTLFYPDPGERAEVMRTVTTKPDERFREWHPVTKDGKTLTTMWANFRLPDGMAFNLGYDITERKQAEEEILEKQVQLDSLLSNVDAIILEGDPYNIYYVGGRVEEILGYRVEDWFDHPDGPTGFWLMHLHPDDKDRFDICVEAISKGESHSFEYRMSAADGRIVWFYDSISVESENGVPVKARSIMIDITDRKKAEEALRESESRFRNLAEASHEGVGISEAGAIVDANKQMAEMLGYTLDEIIGIPVKDLVAPESESVVAHHVSTNSQAAYEHMALKKDGSTILVEARGMATIYKGKQVRVTAVRDITETKRLQEQESRAQRLETVGTIAGQVAHDFNNLLAPLMAYPEFIRECLDLDHPALRYLDQIEKSAQQIADINQQLLSLGRRGHYNQEALNLNEIIRQAVKEMGSLDDNVAYVTDLDPELMNILGGGSQIHRVVTNLLCNAVDALQDGRLINIRTENHYVDDESIAYGRVPRGEYVKLTVTDSGCGMSDDIVQKILDPFFTTKISDKNRGSGLGLSVVDAVVKDHGGFLDLETTLGTGTSFYIYFPTTSKLRDEGQPVNTCGGCETILVVDDDDVQREVSTQLLKKLGYKVNTAASGEMAIDFLRENPQDLVILDMIMPGGIDGAETFRLMLNSNPNQKAIIVSGFSACDRVQEAQALGADNFVKKPLTKIALAVAVRKELDKQAISVV